MSKSDNNLKPESRHWLDRAEIVSVIASGVGTVVGGLYQPAIFACLPISAALALNILNRQRLLNNIQSSSEHNAEQIVSLHNQTEQHEQAIRSQLEQNQLNDTHFAEVFRQVKLAEQKILQVEEQTKNLETGLKNLEVEDHELQAVVAELRSIENMSQALSVNPNSAEFYYQRGKSREHLWDKQGAIADYTQAVRYNSNLADAHYRCGLLHAELGERRLALENLRKAAKLFFEQGDLTNYQNAKDLCRQFHELNGSNGQKSDSMLISNLFS